MKFLPDDICLQLIFFERIFRVLVLLRVDKFKFYVEFFLIEKSSACNDKYLY